MELLEKGNLRVDLPQRMEAANNCQPSNMGSEGHRNTDSAKQVTM